NKKIYVTSDPAAHKVEVAARASALVFTGAGTKILGIGFRRYATNEYPNLDVGAVYGGGASTVFENDVFTAMAGGALNVSSTLSRVSTSVFAQNGFNGLGSNGHQHSTKAADGLVLEGNVFNANNQEHFGDHCSASCAQAGVKLAHMDGFTVKNNVFENNIGHGFWCDLACSKGVIIQNVSKNNARSGIMYEVSDTGIIASNLVIGNTLNGIRFCSANTKVYNNTLVANQGSGSIWLYDDARSYGVAGWTDVGPDTAHVEIANNVVSGAIQSIRVQGQDANAPNTVPSMFFDLLDDDAFFRSAGPTQDLFYWIPPTTPIHYTTLAAFQAAQGADKEAHGSDVSAGADPFFVDAAGGNYAIRPTSSAYRSGRTLPADVAAALGLTTTTVVDRGAIHWPGH
ncbi:MAG: right-handed parallel beta-helix repeat-containing protein, partial [Polyangiaceae bacterium]